MKSKTITVYFCEHCNKLYQKKHFAEKHEIICFKNPKNKRLCYDCVYLSKKDTKEYKDSSLGEISRDVTCFYCNSKGVFLYPPQVSLKQNFIDIDSEEMKTECEDVDYFF